MSPSVRIAALQGGASALIQSCLADFARHLAGAGWRVAGAVEGPASAPPAAANPTAANPTVAACGRLVLRDLSEGTEFAISQALGGGSTACNLDPGGIVSACAAIQRAVAQGADLAVISKFGKLEADGSGLRDAFAAAAAAGIPILTAVSPALTPSWRVFAGPAGRLLPADPAAIAAWWDECGPASAAGSRR